MQALHHGKEIYLFFGIYGTNGIIGIVIAQTIIGIIIYKTLNIANKYKIENYAQLSNEINKNDKINEIIKIIINIFLLLSFYVMIAGFSAYFSQELKIPNIIGTIIIVILCYTIFMGDIEGIIKINTILIPILVFSIILLTIQNLDAHLDVNEKMLQPNFLKAIYSAILYSSYNSITLIPIIISLKKYLKNNTQIILTSIIVAIILTVIAISIYVLILKVDININQLELPTVYVAGMSGKIYKYLYGGIILVAIFTSAVSSGYSILENYRKEQTKYKNSTNTMHKRNICIQNRIFKFDKPIIPSFWSARNSTNIFFNEKKNNTQIILKKKHKTDIK